jgi:hypothetical protein
MRKLIVIFCLGFSFLKTNAQDVDLRIQEMLGEKLQETLTNEPQRIRAFAELLETRLSVVKMPVNPKEDYVKLSTVPLLNKYNSALTRDGAFDPATFNPLKYNLNFFSTKTEVYRIDNTDYIIMIKPQTFK